MAAKKTKSRIDLRILGTGFLVAVLVGVLLWNAITLLRHPHHHYKYHGGHPAAYPTTIDANWETTTVGDGDQTSITLPLSGDIRRITNRSFCEVRIGHGTTPQVVIDAPSDVIGFVKAVQEKTILYIDFDVPPHQNVVIRDGKRLVVAITLPLVQHIDLDGAGSMYVKGFPPIDSLTATVSGAGNVVLDGNGASVMLDISGAGTVDASKWVARHATISLSGAGTAQVFASETITGTVSGAGEITVLGKPAVRNVSVSGAGTVQYL